MKGIGCIVQCIRNIISFLTQIIPHGIHFIIEVIQNVIQLICHLIHASGNGFNIRHQLIGLTRHFAQQTCNGTHLGAYILAECLQLL